MAEHSDLDTLFEEYEAARLAFQEDRHDPELKADYKEKAKRFADARVAQRQEEEADPNHPRGTSVARVTSNGDGNVVEGEVVDGGEQ